MIWPCYKPAGSGSRKDRRYLQSWSVHSKYNSEKMFLRYYIYRADTQLVQPGKESWTMSICNYHFVFLIKMIGQGRVRVLTRLEGRTPALPVEAQVLEDDWLKHYCTKHHSQHSKKPVKLTTACHRKEKEKRIKSRQVFQSAAMLTHTSTRDLCWQNRCLKPGDGGLILSLREATLLASF